MTAAVDEPTSRFLVGLAEAGELLGVSEQRVNQLRRSSSFPEPFEVLACGPIWLRDAIENYDAERRQRPGRVPQS